MFRALANKRRGLQDSMVEEWDRKVVRAFNELTRAELIETESMSVVRRQDPQGATRSVAAGRDGERGCWERCAASPLSSHGAAPHTNTHRCWS